MLMADTTGKKYPPFIIIKMQPASNKLQQALNYRYRHGFGERVWPSIEEYQIGSGCRIYANRAGWWNEMLSLSLLKFHFAGRDNMASDRVLLVLDDLRAHFTPRVRALAGHLNVVLLRVPSRMTWACQPADLAWMKPFKDSMRKMWVAYLRAALSAKVPDEPFKLPSPGREDVIGWSCLHSTFCI
jgi:hypothetical protein